MIRRIVFLLLVPALLANQAAMCCAHTHHGSEINDHSSRAHFHVSGETHRADSNDHQHADGVEHEHSDRPASDGTESNLDFESSYSVGHDNDAIFFGEQDIIRIQSNRLAFDGLVTASLYFVAETMLVKTRNYRSQTTRAGPFLPYRCAIYLQTCCLLI